MITYFFQMNQNKALAAAVELNRRVMGVDNYVCMITEPYKNKCRIVAKPEGSKVLVHKSTKPPRAAIYFKGENRIIQIESLCNEDCVVALWNCGDRSMILVSAYLDIQREAVPLWLEDVCQYAEQRGTPLLLCADSNAHSELFGRTTNKRGKELEDFILTNQLRVENLGTVPTFRAHRVAGAIESCVDVTLTRDTDDRVECWAVEDRYNGSDHNTIVFHIKNDCIGKAEEVRNWRKADWGLFKSVLEAHRRSLYVPKVLNEKKLDKMVEKLYNLLNLSLIHI